MVKFIFTLLIILGFSSNIVAQNNDKLKEYYNITIELIKQKNYTEALKYSKKVLEYNPDNSNYNYLTGFCYLNIDYKKHLSLPYLLKASNNIEKNQTVPNYKKNTAPVDALLFLSEAYYYNYKFFKATETLKEFQKNAPNFSQIKLNELRTKYLNAARTATTHAHFESKHLKSPVNNENNQLIAVSNIDETILYVTELDENNKTHIYQYTKSNGKWENKTTLDQVLNKKNTAKLVALSANANVAILEQNGNLYISENMGQWSEPEKLSSNINSKYDEQSASLSIDGQTLYFSSNRPNGFGGYDIYFSHILPNGKWQKAKNIGSSINTKYDETSCNIHYDNVTMSFSSNRENTIGGYDLFLTEREKDTVWTEPENIGYPINTVYDDINFSFTYDNQNSYYTTDKDNSLGSKDVYKVKIFSIQKASTSVVKGVIKNKAGEVVTDKIIYLTDRSNGKYVGQYKPNSAGEYTFILTPGKKYFISFEDKNIIFSPKLISIPDNSAFSEIGKSINIGTFTTIN